MDGITRHALYERFIRGLAIAPDRPALHLGHETVTYRELHEKALLWAGSLVHGTGRVNSVGVLAGRSLESYVGILAGLYTGATVVPLHPDFPAARTRRMLDVAGVSVLLVDECGRAGLPEVFGDDPGIPVFAPEAGSEAAGSAATIQLGDALDAPRPVAGDDTAYMLFTSGSTGNPKGVPISHGNTAHYFGLLDQRYDFVPEDVFSQTFDLNFDCAMFDLFCAWGAGACVSVVPPQAYRDMPGFMAERAMTVWFSTPSAIALIRKMGGLEPDSMPSLRWSFFAGEALRCADAAGWQAAASGSAVENLYGPTELTVTVTGHRWSSGSSPDRALNGLVPIGPVHQGHEAVLIDADGEASGAEGELCITGPQMTAGYLDPADNEGRFLERDGRTWYRTGDRVRRHDDGELVYVGRLDAQVQVQGWRVELAEVEHALRECAGVSDAVSVTRSVDGNTELVVFYTGSPASPVELSRQLRRILPPGMLPRHFRHLEEFPLNSNRKIDRSRLATTATTL